MRYCASCDNPRLSEINHRIKEGRSLNDISRWLTTLGTPITRQALARHAKTHAEIVVAGPGRKPVSGSFLEKVVSAVEQDIDAGVQRPRIRDGIAAQAELNKQRSRDMDKDILIKISLAMSGSLPAPRDVSPQVAVLEGEFSRLLSPGDG